MRRALWPALIFAVSFAASAIAPPRRTSDLIARGRGLFAVWCVACHGPSGAGDGPTAHTLDPRPRKFSQEKFKQGARVDQIHETLSKGVPGSAMVAFKNLSDDERWALAWYVLELRAGRK